MPGGASADPRKHSAKGLKKVFGKKSSPRSRSASYSKLRYQSPVFRSSMALLRQVQGRQPLVGSDTC